MSGCEADAHMSKHAGQLGSRQVGRQRWQGRQGGGGPLVSRTKVHGGQLQHRLMKGMHEVS